MSSIPLVTLFGVLVVAGIAVVSWSLVFSDKELPQFPVNPYWGPSSSSSSLLQGKQQHDEGDEPSIRSFSINISTHVLQDLKFRLRMEVEGLEERIADPLEGSAFHWGVTKSLLRQVQQHWLHKYDWKERKALLNTWPHFKTNIFGIDIHFQHALPTNRQSQKYKNGNGTRPLLLLHGWPSSFVEFQRMIPLLVEPEHSDINFEVVVPSLPGFGFSGAPARAGCGPPEIAQIFKILMRRLGHEAFYVHGGDWGGIIAGAMATMYPGSILGFHSTFCFSFHPRSLLKFAAALALPCLLLEAQDRARYGDVVVPVMKEGGYFLLQATKPETIGIGLSHSPSGLAAYLLEKFSFATNRAWMNKEDGGIFPYNDLDILIDNIMSYWLGQSTTTNLRIYMHPFHWNWQLERLPVKVPASFLNLPFEPFIQPRAALKEKFTNIVRFTTKVDRGGHFQVLGCLVL